MIEKNIFMIWLGDNIPTFGIYSFKLFKKINPSFNCYFIHYTVDEIKQIILKDNFCAIKNNEIDLVLFECFKKLCNDKKFIEDKLPFLVKFSNTFRWKILNKFGGIYLDCDCFPIKPFDDKLLNLGNFAIRTNYNNIIKEDGFFYGFKSNSYFNINKTFLDPIINGDLIKDGSREKFFKCELTYGYSYNKNSYIEHFCDRSWIKQNEIVKKNNINSIISIDKNSFVISIDNNRLKHFYDILSDVKIPLPINFYKTYNILNTGCTNAHISCINYAIENNLDYIIIFEDDAYPVYQENLKTELNTVFNSVPDDFDILIFGYNGLRRLINYDNIKNKINDTHILKNIQIINNMFFKYDDIRLCGSHAYLVQKKAYKKLLESIKQFKIIDVALTNKNQLLNVYITCKNYFIQVDINKKLLYIPSNMNIMIKPNDNLDRSYKTISEYNIKQKFNYKKIIQLLNNSIVNNMIFQFWTGNNQLSENRLKGLNSSKQNINSNIIFLDYNDLEKMNNYNSIHCSYKKFHPAYKYLSNNHKSDYLRCYFMQFYGGGYLDIKVFGKNNNWKECFNIINNDSTIDIIGVKEYIGSSPCKEYNNENDIKKLLQNGWFICRKNTEFTQKWFNLVNKKLDEKFKQLKNHPAKDPFGTNSDYPLRWTELMGEIFHKLCYEYSEKYPTKIKNCLLIDRQPCQYR